MSTEVGFNTSLYVFPERDLTRDTDLGRLIRYHLRPTLYLLLP